MNLSQSAAVMLFLCARELTRSPVPGAESGRGEGALPKQAESRWVEVKG